MRTGPRQTCTRCGTMFAEDKVLCPDCGHFNTGTIDVSNDTILLSEVKDIDEHRLQSGPWDFCFGHKLLEPEKKGIVKTSLTILGAVPGAGKTTMSLMMADALPYATCICGQCGTSGKEVMYISAEQFSGEIKLYANRLQLKNQEKIRLLSTIGGVEVLARLEAILDKFAPCAIMLDSLPGLVGDDDNTAVELLKLLKSYAIKYMCPVVVIDHVNKEEDLAGLMALQHVVDVILTITLNEDIVIDGEPLRVLRSRKNRFGRAYVETYLAMTERGLVSHVTDDEEEEEEDDE